MKQQINSKLLLGIVSITMSFSCLSCNPDNQSDNDTRFGLKPPPKSPPPVHIPTPTLSPVSTPTLPIPTPTLPPIISDSTFELKSYDLDPPLNTVGSHTFVLVKTNDGEKKFNCWGGDSGGKVHFSGKGKYEVANCYRGAISYEGGKHDTAYIGIYAINGVCHQTANLFLFPTGKIITIADGVKGYWFSSLMYGIYGNTAPGSAAGTSLKTLQWLSSVYAPCALFFTGSENVVHGTDIFNETQNLIKTIDDSHKLIYKQSELLAKKVVSTIPDFEDIHKDFMNTKDSVISSGLKGESLANKLNEELIIFEKKLENKIGSDSYKVLTGLNSGEYLGVVRTDIAKELNIAPGEPPIKPPPPQPTPIPISLDIPTP